jgi:hypothetical protein
MKNKKPIKNRYRIKKQWGEILPRLTIPSEIPFDFTKNFKIFLTNGDEKIIKNKRDFDSFVTKAMESGKEIENIMVELNYEKLIIDVEKKFYSLLKISE